MASLQKSDTEKYDLRHNVFIHKPAVCICGLWDSRSDDRLMLTQPTSGKRFSATVRVGKLDGSIKAVVDGRTRTTFCQVTNQRIADDVETITVLTGRNVPQVVGGEPMSGRGRREGPGRPAAVTNQRIADDVETITVLTGRNVPQVVGGEPMSGRGRREGPGRPAADNYTSRSGVSQPEYHRQLLEVTVCP
ncbi:hypothetical protein Bbelb_181580 [Branchiostoma belcheri]|nr:hypothetical protein Bbelb_181580 [Branchiostoma belcheri]